LSKKLDNEPFFYYISFNAFGKVSLPLYENSVHFGPKTELGQLRGFYDGLLLGSTVGIWWKIWFINFEKALYMCLFIKNYH